MESTAAVICSRDIGLKNIYFSQHMPFTPSLLQKDIPPVIPASGGLLLMPT
jgi:hypothetical protein